jgi:hypothetical protein
MAHPLREHLLRPARRMPARRLAAAVVLAALALVAAPDAGAAARPDPAPVSPGPLAVAASGSNSDALSPPDIHAAYALPSTGPRGQTIAVVTAYDDRTAQSDLAVFSSQFGLRACTTSNGCFRKVNQRGVATPVPGPDPTGANWIQEASLGTQVARGVCQNCSILLVEADAASKPDLSAAVDVAASMGAQVVVTSFSPPELIGDSSQFAADYSHPGTVVVAATGDQGYTGGISFPAALPNVVAVGGTELTLSAKLKYVSETAWNQGGSGCSLYTPAPAWQAALRSATGCASKRSVADIAAVADPGALVYISGIQGLSGGAWYEVAGTSFSAPIIGGALALAGGGSSFAAQRLYQRARSDPGAYRDITTGANNAFCANQAYCAARPGYDGPTGLGTPYGLAAFSVAGAALDRHHPQIAASAPRNRLRVGAHWIARLGLRNDNAFTVGGSLVVRGRLRIGGRLRTIKFATARFTLAPLGNATEPLTIAPHYRQLLKRLRSVAVTVELQARGAAGRTVTVTKSLRLYAP